MSTPTHLEDHLGFWLRRVSNHVSARFAKSLGSRGVSIAEWVALRILFDLREASPSTLASELSMTQGAISKVADKLIAKGWVEIQHSPIDRRGRVLSVTTEGRNAVSELAAIADKNDHFCFEVLTEEDQDVLRKILERYTEAHKLSAEHPTE